MTDSLEHALITREHTASDLQAFLLLVSSEAHVPDLPHKFQPDNDLLGLVEHDNVRGAYARVAFNRLDFIARTVISADPEKSKQFIDGERVHIARVKMGPIHHSDLSRTELADGTVEYHVERVDEGTKGGGFWFVKRHEGTILFKVDGLELQEFDVDHELYLHALAQANAFIDIIANQQHVPIATLPADTLEFYTGDAFKDTMRNQHSRKHRAIRKLGKVIHKSKETALKLVTNYKDYDEDGLPVHNRELAWKKIACLALAVPIPGITGTFGDTAIPRPVGIAVAEGLMHKVDDVINADDRKIEATKQALADYDAKNLDLPESANLEIDGQSHPIAVVPDSLGDEVESAPTVTIAYDRTTGDGTPSVAAASPRKLTLNGVLDAGECQTITVSPEESGNTFAMLGRTEKDVDGLGVETSASSISVCNTNPSAVSLRDRTLYIDTDQ